MTGIMLMGLLLTAEAKRGEDGTPLTVRVMDVGGEPIPTAVIRNPKEGTRHRVNTVTGEWSATTFYMPDGTEYWFTPGDTIRFEISASGYDIAIVDYEMQRRGNTIEVSLTPLEEDDEEVEMPVTPFLRDHAREPTGTAPVN